MSPTPRNTLREGTPAGVTPRLALARLARLALRAVVVLTLAIGLTTTSATGPTEYQIKATLLFNLVKFTEWPSSAFTNVAAPLVLAVVGEDPFDHTLDDVVKGESVNKHPLVVKRFQPGEDLSLCHVLFISRSEKERLPALMESLKNKPIMSVGDLGRFCERGGIVNLVLSTDGTVKPEINPDAARAAGLQISSKLLNLRMVRLVKTEP